MRFRVRPTAPVPLAAALAAALAATGVGLSLPSAVAAQEDRGGLFLDAGASRSLSPSGSEVDPSTYLLGGGRLNVRSGGGLGFRGSLYGGVSLEETAGDWAALEVGGRWAAALTPRLFANVDLRGQAFTVGEPFRYRAVTGDLRPRLDLALGAVWLGLTGRTGIGRSEAEVEADPGLPPRIVPTGEVVTDLWVAGGGPEVRVGNPDLWLSLGAQVLDSELGTYRKLALELAGRLGRVRWSADVTGWDTPLEGDDVSGGITFSLGLPGFLDLSGGGRRVAPDPLLQTPAAVSGSGLVSARVLTFGPGPGGSGVGPGGGPASERPFRVEKRGDVYRLRLRVHRPEAERVVVLGDFTGWEEVPLQGRDGIWVAELTVRPGVHHFGFRVDGAWWIPEEAPGRVEDDWGRTNATVVVGPEVSGP